MNRPRSRQLGLLLALAVFGELSFATEVLVLGNESMPWNGVVQGKPSGIIVEILDEAANYGAPKFNYRLGIPWARAQAEVLKPHKDPVAIIPLSRNAEREGQFKWIAELVQSEFHIVTFGRPAPIKSLDEAKDLKIGLIRGHAAIPMLQRMGFNKIDDNASDAKQNALKLRARRVDALIDGKLNYLYHWREIEGNTKDLQEGPKVGNDVDIYIAGGPDFPDDVARSIADAIAEMRKNGRLQEIIDKWH